MAILYSGIARIAHKSYPDMMDFEKGDWYECDGNLGCWRVIT